MLEKRIIVIFGPTAIGKTEISIQLAKRIGGEIVSADSMQIYKGMNIGSAKPSLEEMAGIPHHLIDFVDPKDFFTVREYQKLAKDVIEGIFARGRIPIVVGGTGLYINSLIYDMDFGASEPDIKLREELEKLAREKGHLALHQLLAKRNKEGADRIHPNNVKKVIRALERLETEGEIKAFAESRMPTCDYESCLIGLNMDRKALYARIDRRVDILIEKGLIGEISALKNGGLTLDHISMLGIGYKEIFKYLDGVHSLDEAIELIKRNSRNYGKRQLTWFKKIENTNWIDLSSVTKEEAIVKILMWWEDDCESYKDSQ